MTDALPTIGHGIATVQYDDNVRQPLAHITTIGGDDTGEDAPPPAEPEAIKRLHEFATTQGDISSLLSDDELTRLGADAVREWNDDNASRSEWMDMAKEALDDAAQEKQAVKNTPWDGAANVRYPLMTVAANNFNARAGPAIIKNDEAVAVRVFGPKPQQAPPMPPQLQQALQASQQPAPQAPGAPPAPPAGPEDPKLVQALQAYQQTLQQAQQATQAYAEKQARANRIKDWLNYCLFYEMPDWEGDLDALLSQIPIVGIGFKKVFSTFDGLRSEYVSALHFTVHQDTRSLETCPRMTHDFEKYPYEIDTAQRSGVYRYVSLPDDASNPQAPRCVIEQYRMDDLDGDGMAEPYIVTVDVQTNTVLRVEPAFSAEDITVDGQQGIVLDIKRWNPWVAFPFLPDPKGRFYAIGYGALLRPLVETIDTGINQLIDAGTAEIAGGGFIASGVRMQGTGQAGVVEFSPGEYVTVNVPPGQLQSSIWERTTPHPSAVMFELLQLMVSQAKDVASVQDVLTGDAPTTAPVGTTLAILDQALQPFSSLYKRVYRGLKSEYRLMYECERRWASPKTKALYEEITGGDFDSDFAGDGRDIQPIGDPTVVTRQQALARIQATQQLAESPSGQAAGMLQPGPAGERMKEALSTIGVADPERYLAPPQPNQLAMAQTAKEAAMAEQAKANAGKAAADAGYARARTVETLGKSLQDSHDLRMAGDAMLGPLTAGPLSDGGVNGQTNGSAPPANAA